MTGVFVVAHAGPGHTWQAMVVVAGIALMVVLLAASIGRLPMGKVDDLIMPLAIIAIVSSLAPMFSTWLSDAVAVGLPLGVIALVTLLLAALTPLDIRLPAPLPMGAIVLAVIATVGLYRPLTVALHPPADVLPLAEAVDIEIVAPTDGDALDDGAVDVQVAIVDGSIGPGDLTLDEVVDDPQRAGDIVVATQRLDVEGSTQQRVDVELAEHCSLDDPCTDVSFVLDLDPGTHRVTVEFVRGDGTPFATPIRDHVEFTTG